MAAHDILASACTGPLRIDALAVPAGGTLGLCHCPGRNGLDGKGRRWQRNLASDLAAIEAWGATTLLTLVEPHEFEKLGVPGFAEAAGRSGLDWHHVPIPDMRAPQPPTIAAWARSGPAIVAALRRGERVAIHCAAGLGRTGSIAAKLLAEFGVPPAEAILQVRAVRPGSIESAEQEAFVLDDGALRLP
jgi:protein-tyrosine phosphatase